MQKNKKKIGEELNDILKDVTLPYDIENLNNFIQVTFILSKHENENFKLNYEIGNDFIKIIKLHEQYPKITDDEIQSIEQCKFKYNKEEDNLTYFTNDINFINYVKISV